MIEIHGICNRVLWKWRIFNRFLGERLRRNCWLLTSQNHHHDGSHFGIDGICRERKVKWSGFGNRTKLWLEIIGELKICYFFQIKWVQDLRFPREIWNWPDLAVFLNSIEVFFNLYIISYLRNDPWGSIEERSVGQTCFPWSNRFRSSLKFMKLVVCILNLRKQQIWKLTLKTVWVCHEILHGIHWSSIF